MRLFFLFFLATGALLASNLLTYNIYERSDRVDVMLSFDSPYEGRIFQKRGENITTLTLRDLSYTKLVEKTINSSIIQGITIQPDKDTTDVILKSASPVAVIASKTVDGFGLRIRTKPISVSNTAKQTTTNTISKQTGSSEEETSPFPFETATGATDLIDGRYLSVVGVLLALLIFMLWIKRRILNKAGAKKQQNSWLFKPSKNSSDSTEVQVLNQKPIDNSNSVVLLSFQGRKYLVMTGSSNLLLERFSNEDIKDDKDFEQAFEDNRKKLDEYLKIQQQNASSNPYKSRAAQEYISKLERS